MNTQDYLDRLLARYAATFDLYMPYRIGQENYPAYGYFTSRVEKYVLSREAKLWASDSFEHILFLKKEKLALQDVEEAKRLICEYMEPVLVRKEEKYPEENHMYSYLTVVLLTEQEIAPEIAKAVRKISFVKGYKFNFRGYSQARVAAVSMKNEVIVLSKAAKSLKQLFTEVFQDIKDHKKGFAQICEEENITPKTNC